MANGKARASGSVYRDEAAELMAAAARSTARQPAPPPDIPPRRTAAPEISVESRRPLPYPEPVGFNDNDDELEPAPRAQRRRVRPLQLAARILIAPWYAVVVAGSLGIIVLFVRGFFA